MSLVLAVVIGLALILVAVQLNLFGITADSVNRLPAGLLVLILAVLTLIWIRQRPKWK